MTTVGFAASLGGKDRSAASSGITVLDLNARPSYFGYAGATMSSLGGSPSAGGSAPTPAKHSASGRQSKDMMQSKAARKRCQKAMTTPLDKHSAARNATSHALVLSALDCCMGHTLCQQCWARDKAHMYNKWPHQVMKHKSSSSVACCARVMPDTARICKL